MNLSKLRKENKRLEIEVQVLKDKLAGRCPQGMPVLRCPHARGWPKCPLPCPMHAKVTGDNVIESMDRITTSTTMNNAIFGKRLKKLMDKEAKDIKNRSSLWSKMKPNYLRFHPGARIKTTDGREVSISGKVIVKKKAGRKKRPV